MTTVALIQARMGSTRLPGKVLMEISGESMLSRVVRRVRQASTIDDTLVATTVSESDDAVVDECRRLDVRVFRGSEEDVLDRYYRAATLSHATDVVRITADCPLIDPVEVERVLAAFRSQSPDYASNGLVPTLPRGLDTEVFTIAALQAAWSEALEPYQRVHVTPFIYEQPRRFRLLPVTVLDPFDGRWTVDTPEDLKFIREVYARVPDRDRFGWRDVIAILEREPGLVAINEHVQQRAVADG